MEELLRLGDDVEDALFAGYVDDLLFAVVRIRDEQLLRQNVGFVHCGDITIELIFQQFQPGIAPVYLTVDTDEPSDLAAALRDCQTIRAYPPINEGSRPGVRVGVGCRSDIAGNTGIGTVTGEHIPKDILVEVRQLVEANENDL